MALQGSLEEAARVVSEKAREAAINIQEARARHDDTETMARLIGLVKSDVDVIRTFKRLDISKWEVNC